MPDLAISKIDAFALREPVSKRAYTVVRVVTRSGITGYGECGLVSAADLERTRAAALGREATASESIARDLAPMPRLRAAINMAVLDLVGKSAKAPVYQLLGGPTRAKARALARLWGNTDASLAASLERVRAMGFRAVVVPTPVPSARNQGQTFALASVRRLEEFRKAAPDMDFVLDGDGSLTPGDASTLAAAFERFHLLWFDEPCRVGNLSAIRKISSETVTPLGFGRSLERPADFQELLREQVIDVVRPDLAFYGISQIRRIAALAETYYTAVAPNHLGGPIGTAAALHLAASLPNFFIQQIPLPEADEDRRMRAELLAQTVEKPVDGYFPLPSEPGLGVTVREQAFEKYAERIQ